MLSRNCRVENMSFLENERVVPAGEDSCVSDAGIGIYQAAFSEAVREYIDPGFITLDWLHNPSPELRELALHKHILDSRLYERHRLTGLFSPKFFSKTNLTSAQVRRWIARNPGHEVYGFNGRSFVPYVAYNSIERGAFLFPGFEQGVRQVCREIGFDLPAQPARQTNAQSLQCNYWCATPEFWERWGKEIVYPIFEIARRGNSLAGAVFSVTPYLSPTPVFLIAFIYEVLISNYIQANNIQSVMYPWSPEEILDLTLPEPVKGYLAQNIPWIDEVDRSRRWTPDARARLAGAFSEFLRQSDIRHEANSFDLSSHDLPSRKPPPIAPV